MEETKTMGPDDVYDFQHSMPMGEVKIAFIIAKKRNNVAVLFGTLKVQSFILTEVSDFTCLYIICMYA